MEPGHVISGKYRVLRLLGDGGMGAVYEAHHEVLGARVAIKVLHEDMARKPELVDRFLREARVLAQISNPHVVRVLDIAMPEAGRPAYIVMELLAGEPLSALLARERKLPLAVAVDHATQVLEALGAAHALGVIHRDLKPENIFVTKDGDRTVLKLIDFGIAKAGSLAGASANLTVAGALMGTPEYMAPEQAHSADRADARSDVYAVGVLLYEMLAGARPVDGDDPRLIAMKVERGDVHPLIHRVPEVPRELAGLVHRAMAARPELRFGTATEMRQALQSSMAANEKRASMPPVAAVAAGANGSGTMFGEPADLRDGVASVARVSASDTDPSDPRFTPAYVLPAAAADPQTARAGAGSWRPPAEAAYGPRSPSVPSPGLASRARRRGPGRTVWVLVGLGVVAAIGVGVALAFSGSSTPQPAARIDAVRTPVDPTAPLPGTPTSPASEPTLDPSLGPLPSGPTLPVPRAITPGPHGIPSASPPPSGAPSGVPGAPLPSGPLGLPPFSLPTSFPNPFPNPAASGVGPVFTIPTTFPPFGFPPDPGSAPPAPAPTPSTAPRRH